MLNSDYLYRLSPQLQILSSFSESSFLSLLAFLILDYHHQETSSSLECIHFIYKGGLKVWKIENFENFTYKEEEDHVESNFEIFEDPIFVGTLSFSEDVAFVS